MKSLSRCFSIIVCFTFSFINSQVLPDYYLPSTSYPSSADYFPAYSQETSYSRSTPSKATAVLTSTKNFVLSKPFRYLVTAITTAMVLIALGKKVQGIYSRGKALITPANVASAAVTGLAGLAATSELTEPLQTSSSAFTRSQVLSPVQNVETTQAQPVSSAGSQPSDIISQIYNTTWADTQKEQEENQATSSAFTGSQVLSPVQNVETTQTQPVSSAGSQPSDIISQIYNTTWVHSLLRFLEGQVAF